MQNEFEKQVQQKMEELKLVPSDPVWEKVEMQIRKKKDRRRVIFWIPLFALIGAGLWSGIDQYSNRRIAYNKENDKTSKQNSIDVPGLNKKATEENHSIKQDQQTTTNNKKSVKQTKPEISTTRENDFSSNVVRKNFSEKIKKGKEISFVEKKFSSSKVEETFPVENKTVNESIQQHEKITPSDSNSNTIQSPDTTTSIEEKVDTKTDIEKPTKKDSTSIKKSELKKQASSKWKYNLVVATGTSGLGRINVYNGQKSLSYTPSYNSGGATTGGNFFYSGPSEVEKGLSFSFGAAVKKQLGKRTSFSTGLQYNYYSNTIHVGSKVNQARTIMDYAVTQFYSNQTTVLQPYKNQYHFISVPANIDWQLLKKHPLNLNFGLSFQYLVQTNALRFDYNTQSYFHDIAAFNRMQLFSGFSLTYSVPVKQKPLSFGPQLQYGLTRLEKGNSDHHLFAYGLKAKWQFKK